MDLPNELKYSLPREVNVNRITQHAKLPCGLASPLGETHLFACEGRLLVLSRNKPNEEFAFFETKAEDPARLIHEEWQDILILKSAKGDKVRIPIPNKQVGPVSFLINEAKQPAAPESVDTPAAELPPQPQSAAAEITVDPTDAESLQSGVRAALRAGDYIRADSFLETLRQLSLKYAPEADDVAKVADALKAGALEEAFLRTELSDFGLMGAKDAALIQVARAFEQRGEQVWAAAAHLACMEEQDETGLARTFRALGKDHQREEHHDWLLSEFEQKRSALISDRIVKTRTESLWRELRARLAGRRGGQALALRELKTLSDRFPGTVTVETARLRYLWESGQRSVFERLLERSCGDFSDSPKDLVRLLRVAEDLGAPASLGAEGYSRLVELLPQDGPINKWVNGVDLTAASGGGTLIWIGAAAAAAAVLVGAFMAL